MAAFGQVRIEVEINDNKPGITGLRVPATPALR